MTLFAVIGFDHEPSTKRDALRGAHLDYVLNDQDNIRMVGPMFDEAGAINGSIYLFEAESADAIRAWLAQDPYYRNGVYREVVIRRFEVRKNDIPIRVAPPRPR